MDETNITTEIDIPDVEAMDISTVDGGMSTGTKVGLALGVGTAIGMGVSYAWKKIKSRKADPDDEPKPRKGFIKLGRRKKDEEDLEDYDESDIEPEE